MLPPMSIGSSAEPIASPLRSGGRAGVFWGAGVIKSCVDVPSGTEQHTHIYTHTHTEETYHCHQLDSDHQDLKRTRESSFKSFKLLIAYITVIVFFWPHYLHSY